MNRETLAKRYITGLGIEIGALNSPWLNPNKATILYADRGTKEVVGPAYDVKKGAVNAILDAKLQSVFPGTLDFICNSHVFEHLPNPLRELETWLDKLKPGGHIVMAIPEMTQTFDKGRELTPYTHLVEDYNNSEAHKGEIDQHFHCWTEESMKYLFEYLRVDMPKFKYNIVEWKFIGHEVFVVLRK
jgi:SAM-dependent methyltransferase